MAEQLTIRRFYRVAMCEPEGVKTMNDRVRKIPQALLNAAYSEYEDFEDVEFQYEEFLKEIIDKYTNELIIWSDDIVKTKVSDKHSESMVDVYQDELSLIARKRIVKIGRRIIDRIEKAANNGEIEF